MLPAAVVIAGLAMPEVPPRPPIAIETRWSLEAGTAPVALIGPRLPAVEEPTLALADQPTGPGQVVAPPVIDPAPPREPKVEVLPPTAATSAAPDTRGDELAEQTKPANDPLEGLNRVSFDVSQALDKVVIRPASVVYKTVVPKPLRDGVRNGLSNFGEPFVFVNDILQLKPKRALRTLGRFLLNSILGIGGLFDVAKDKKFRLPHHANSFSDTLGFYGVKPGPYIYVPLFGPMVLRDIADRFQGNVPGLAFDNPVFRDGRGTIFQVVSGLDLRVENDAELKALLDDAIDPYATFRSTWLQDKQGEVDALKAPDGIDPGSQPTTSPLDDPLIDPAPPPAEPAQTESAPAADPLDDPLADPAAKPAP
jgi:phospholipid-binding lipoprotein MlaA